ncbi:hypothetical protein C7212DRAFT_318030, partial [Tuber magnatum]
IRKRTVYKAGAVHTIRVVLIPVLYSIVPARLPVPCRYLGSPTGIGGRLRVRAYSFGLAALGCTCTVEYRAKFKKGGYFVVRLFYHPFSSTLFAICRFGFEGLAVRYETEPWLGLRF